MIITKVFSTNNSTKQLVTGHLASCSHFAGVLSLTSIVKVNCSSRRRCELLCVCEPKIIISFSGSCKTLGPTDLQLMNPISMAKKL